MQILLAQQNFLVGDIKANAEKIIEICQQATDSDVIVFPELALTGYPPEDLLLRPDFHRLVDQYLQHIIKKVSHVDILLGYPRHTPQGIFNACAYIQQGKLTAHYHKQYLPNYGIFDEKRYFIAGKEPLIIHYQGLAIGILICEDLWHSMPCEQAINAGAQLILCINASPYDFHKAKQRENLIKQHIDKHHIPIIYVHGVGGQDELVFDGGSLCINAQGDITHYGERYVEQLIPIIIDTNTATITSGEIATPLNQQQQIYQALCLGLRDYVTKNNFNGVILGLSGGIDSALTLTVAVDALGSDKVTAVMLPSQYTSQMSLDDAAMLAKNLNVNYHVLPIDGCFTVFLETLEPLFTNTVVDTTEQNVQARCRGVLLMALSNKKGQLLLTTGNKSEVAVGYATLYGDMCGGFSVLKDVSKTLVYQLANYRNTINADIPQRIITRPPSAELAEGQLDQDSLPDYNILDQILEYYIEQDKSIADIVSAGFEEPTVRQVIDLVDKNEYKRRQAAPGVKITHRAFGRDRRYPITSGFGHDIIGECQDEKS